MTGTITAFTARTTDEAAIFAMLDEMYAAWRAGDADAFVRDYNEDATAVLPGSLRGSRQVIRDSMAAAFAGPLRGSSTVDEPLSLRFLGEDAAIAVCRSGVLLAGESAVPEDRLMNATWVFERRDGRWGVAGYHNSPAQVPAKA